MVLTILGFCAGMRFPTWRLRKDLWMCCSRCSAVNWQVLCGSAEFAWTKRGEVGEVERCVATHWDYLCI